MVLYVNRFCFLILISNSRIYFRICPGSWVEARYSTKRGFQHFREMDLDHTEQDLQVKFLTKKEGFLVFLEKEKVFWVPRRMLPQSIPRRLTEDAITSLSDL